MVEPVINEQLALMLALQNLEVPLRPEEKAALEKAGENLAPRPKHWELIVQNLMPVIEANERLKYLYQTAKNQLDVLEYLPPELLPTEEELKQELPADKEREVRQGKKPTTTGNSPNTEWINVIVPDILLKPEIAKNLSFLERISTFLQKLPQDNFPTLL